MISDNKKYSVRSTKKNLSSAEVKNLLDELDTLRRKVDFLESVLNEMPVPVFVKDAQARFTFFNKAYESFFSMRREDMLGATVLDLEYLDEEDRKKYQNEDIWAINTAGSVHYETAYDGARGIREALYFVKGFSTPKFSERGLVGAVVDISQQKLLERELASRVGELDRTRRELRKLSQTDPLTTLPNRRFFESRLAEWVPIATRHRRPLSLFMLDIDFFKRVNDHFGHDVGDAMLRKVSDTMRSVCRREDTIARFGGDEFVGLLPLTQIKGAKSLAEHIHEAVKKSCRLPDGEHVTVSIGVAEFRPGYNDKSLLKHADEALYRAKERGRDMVCE